MACNLLSFQGLQAERRDSIPLRSTIRSVEESTGLFFLRAQLEKQGINVSVFQVMYMHMQARFFCV